MKIAQEDKTLMDKWETKRKIKKKLIKRFAEYRQRCEKSCNKIDPQGKIFHFDFEQIIAIFQTVDYAIFDH